MFWGHQVRSAGTDVTLDTPFRAARLGHHTAHQATGRGLRGGGQRGGQLSQGVNPKQPRGGCLSVSQFKLCRAPSPAPLPLPEPLGNGHWQSSPAHHPSPGDPEVALGLPLHPGARPSI